MLDGTYFSRGREQHVTCYPLISAKTEASYITNKNCFSLVGYVEEESKTAIIFRRKTEQSPLEEIVLHFNLAEFIFFAEERNGNI